MLKALFLLIIGFTVLYMGAEWLVKGASKFARLMGLSPLVIGLTVVAFGTSAPELLVSLVSAIKGKGMIAIGNVVGSNICNIALVLGTASLFRPIVCQRGLIKRDIPIMIGISIFLIVISIDSKIGRLDGFFLFSFLIIYIVFNYYGSEKKDQVSITEDIEPKGEISKLKQLVFIIIGILFVISGAQMVVSGAEDIMRIFGISEKVIGLSIIAFGTSLPELATSVVAAYRRHMDISIGNLIGSNVFNIMCVLGLTALIRPIPISGGLLSSRLFIDYIIMIFISTMPWFMIKKDLLISRRDGFNLLLFYFAYIIYLYLFPTH